MFSRCPTASRISKRSFITFDSDRLGFAYAEGIVKLHVQPVKPLVDRDAFRLRFEYTALEQPQIEFDGRGEIGMAAPVGSGDDRGRDRRSKGAGLRASGDLARRGSSHRHKSASPAGCAPPLHRN